MARDTSSITITNLAPVKRKGLFLILLILLLFTLGIDLIYERGLYTIWSPKVIARLDAESTHELLRMEDPQILDARTEAEFQVSHIEKAIRFEPEVLKSLDKDEPVLVYCTAGVRSNSLAVDLVNSGFTHVYELKGGLIHWKNNNYQVVNPVGGITDSLHTFSAPFAPFLKNGTPVY